MEKKVYGCSASQRGILLQEKYSIHKGMCQIPVFCTVEHDIDTALLKKAIDIEIERNDALRDRIKVDKKTGAVEQTFEEAYLYEKVNGPIEEYDLRGKKKEEQEKLITKLSSQEIKFREFHLFKVAFINKTYDNKFGFLFAASHMVCDAWGTFITIADIFDVYFALLNQTEMPKPLASFESGLERDIMSQTEKKDQEDITFYRDFYDKMGAPKRFPGIIDTRLPHKVREGKKAEDTLANTLKSLIFDKAGQYVYTVDREMVQNWKTFCAETSIPFSTLITLGCVAYLAKINGSNDVFFNDECNCRATVSDKHSAGCRTNPIYPRFMPDDQDSVETVCSEIQNTIMQFFRHAGVDSDKIMVNGLTKWYNISNYNYYGSIIFSIVSVLYRFPTDWNFDFQIVSTGHFVIPEYIVVLIDDFGNLKFNIEYQLAYTNEIQVKATAEGIRDAVNAAVSDKTITFRQLKDSIK